MKILVCITHVPDTTSKIAFINGDREVLISGWTGFLQRIHLKSKEVLYSPGCMTPTEIIVAETAGVTFIKLFPGNALGPGFMSAIKDVFPNLKFMPTGGVDTTKESIDSWFKAGVSAVGMGSKLVSKELMLAKDYATIEIETKKVLEIIQTLK